MVTRQLDKTTHRSFGDFRNELCIENGCVFEESRFYRFHHGHWLEAMIEKDDINDSKIAISAIRRITRALKLFHPPCDLGYRGSLSSFVRTL